MQSNQQRNIRLYQDCELRQYSIIRITNDDHHYLRNVMRVILNDELFIFNGLDGEWNSRVLNTTRNYTELEVMECVRPQAEYTKMDCYFSPLNGNRHTYIIEKLTELGISSFTPVITEFSNIRKVNNEKLLTRAKEAAEQCGLMRVPKINREISLSELLNNWNSESMMIFCDEKSNPINPMDELSRIKGLNMCFLIGPEGGFSDKERYNILKLPNIIRLSLGARVLRADTAAIVIASFLQVTNGQLFCEV